MIESLPINVPTLLTLVRLVVSPLVMPLLLITLLPLNQFELNGILAIIFVLLSLTDFFDGYLARQLRQETALGSLLDPIADKFLIYSTVIALVQADKLFFYWAIIIIGREFFVMGLREISLYHGFIIAVSPIGKLKTALQIAFLTIVILNPAQHIHGSPWNIGEIILLITTLFFTVYSAFLYGRDFARQWKAFQKDY